MKLQGKRETFLSAYKKLFSIFLPAVFYLSLVPSSFLFSQEPVSEIMPEPLYVPVQVNVRDGKTFRRDMVYAVIDEKFELQSYSGSRLIGLFTGLVEIQHLSSLEGVEWVTPSMLEEAGMVVSYDPSRIVSEIYIPPAIQPVRDISLRGEKKASNLPRVEPAGFSGALPFYVTFYHTKSSLDVPEEFRDRSEYGLNLFPWVSVDGYVASGKINTVFSSEETEVRDWEAAVSRDYGEWLRLTAGTSRIDAMDFQSSDPVFGFSAEKREGIGRTSVLGDRYSKHITIETESTADVYVNGKLVRSERIMPGRYDVTAFPLVPGLNVVEMVITDIYGTKNVLTGSVTHAPRIPDPGEYEYGAAAGAAGTDKDAFLARGYYRRGFTDFFGADFYTEMTKDARMAGSTLLASAVPGFFELGGAFLVSESYSPAEMEYGVVGRYSFSSSAGKWLPSAGLSALFRTEQFTAPGSLIDAYRPYVPPWVFSLTVTQPLPKDSSLLAGARYTVGRDEISNTASIYSYYARRLSRLLTLRAGISFDYNGEENTLRGSISVGSMAKDGKGSYSATYYTDGHEVDLGASRRFSGSYGNGSAGVNITRLDIAEGSAQGISGNANGGNDRMEASASVSVVPDEEGFFNSPQRVSFSTRFGSGIYFADGLAGAGKPSEGSFAVIGKSDTFPEGDLLVNPGEKTREASSGILGNAVLASLPDYHEKIINIDLPDLPMDYSIANSSFIIETGYRSGTAIRIEGGRLFFGSGRLIDSAGNPAGLTVFRITDRNTGSRFTTFTDEGGYFYIYDLYPGNYLIEMPGDEEALAFTVSDTAEVPFDLGEIVTEFFRE